VKKIRLAMRRSPPPIAITAPGRKNSRKMRNNPERAKVQTKNILLSGSITEKPLF
jgi:hypothetical protein